MGVQKEEKGGREGVPTSRGDRPCKSHWHVRLLSESLRVKVRFTTYINHYQVVHWSIHPISYGTE